MSTRYEPARIEPRWQQYWDEHKTFRAVEDPAKPRYYALDMFPYPSGAGLHVGHPEGYTATDIMSRYKRMRGFAVLHPMGWDAFGLPAEQYAIQTGQHPAPITRKNIQTFKRQLKSLGLSYDWDREISTCEPEYYRWTQWIFLQLLKRDLAYVDEVPVNWCPALGTVLANEEVVDGLSERGNHPVFRVPMRQWVLRITKYADRLLDDLEEVDWPEGIKEMQRNWIGRSEGAQIRFELRDHPGKSFEVFTTRPDTLFGATYCVLAPEHPLVNELTTQDQADQVRAYRERSERKSDRERTELAKEKTGVFTGAYAINPANGAAIPVWIADYVLGHYGTGAIMAVPGHDERDWEFAQAMGLPMIEVVAGGDLSSAAHTGDGPHKNSGFLDGLNVVDAKSRMNDWLEQKGLGTRRITYRLRDWVFSRQRYWGEPFPVYRLADGTYKAVPESELPVTLPMLDEIKPSGTGESPLANAKDWLKVVDPETGLEGLRETNTMPNWAGSCWYYLRYLDPLNEEALCSKEKADYWLPVDLYVGGAEHAVLHLLYARFWHKVLYDIGVVSCKEPFRKLVNQGLILGSNGEKMSKSLGNVVNPDDIVKEYGADTLRVYEMFMGPLEAVKPWDTNGLEGCSRFLNRVWRLIDAWLESSGEESPDDVRRIRHITIRKVTEDIEAMRFNTAISQLMIYTNELYKQSRARREDLETLVILLSPFAPHLAEECWNRLGHADTLAFEAWPAWVEAYTLASTVTYAIQVNGKLRGQVEVGADTPGAEAIAMAKVQENVAKHLEGKQIVKEICVPQKLINFVVK